jgi:hypothetical protein
MRGFRTRCAGAAHPFGRPTGYEMLYEGRRYAPKAVIGLACLYSIGKVMQPSDFSGGEAPGPRRAVDWRPSSADAESSSLAPGGFGIVSS